MRNTQRHAQRREIRASATAMHFSGSSLKCRNVAQGLTIVTGYDEIPFPRQVITLRPGPEPRSQAEDHLASLPPLLVDEAAEILMPKWGYQKTSMTIRQLREAPAGEAHAGKFCLRGVKREGDLHGGHRRRRAIMQRTIFNRDGRHHRKRLLSGSARMKLEHASFKRQTGNPDDLLVALLAALASCGSNAERFPSGARKQMVPHLPRLRELVHVWSELLAEAGGKAPHAPSAGAGHEQTGNCRGARRAAPAAAPRVVVALATPAASSSRHESPPAKVRALSMIVMPSPGVAITSTENLYSGRTLHFPMLLRAR